MLNIDIFTIKKSSRIYDYPFVFQLVICMLITLLYSQGLSYFLELFWS